MELYDYIPVIVPKRADANAIVGLFHADAFRTERPCKDHISDHMLPLTEDYLIGVGTSIRDFVIEAHEKPCRLVVSAGGFSGLVTLSDLQRLPVRAMLFALITGFEMTMAEAIERWFPMEADWLALLTAARQKELRKEIEKSKKAGRRRQQPGAGSQARPRWPRPAKAFSAQVDSLTIDPSTCGAPA